MKTLRYLVRINKDPDSDWGASVPDLPGCVATGKTIDSTSGASKGQFNFISVECKRTVFDPHALASGL